MQAPEKEKKIKYLSIWKTIGLLGIGGLFTFEGIFYHNIFVAIFFGLVIIMAVYPFVNPKVKIIWIGTKKFKESIAEESSKKFDDPGIFTYSETGFDIAINNGTYHHNWEDIMCMVAYKRDDVTTDCICMDVFFANGKQLAFNEETPGWHQFIKKTKEHFPQINKLWDLEITSPAFKKNLTLVFDREGRTLDEALKIHYPAKEKIK